MTPTAKALRDTALLDVEIEMDAQVSKWGEQNHDPFAYLAILTEEVGESAKAALEFLLYGQGTLAHLRTELVQVAAVATSMVEALDRGTWELHRRGAVAGQTPKGAPPDAVLTYAAAGSITWPGMAQPQVNPETGRVKRSSADTQHRVALLLDLVGEGYCSAFELQREMAKINPHYTASLVYSALQSALNQGKLVYAGHRGFYALPTSEVSQ